MVGVGGRSRDLLLGDLINGEERHVCNDVFSRMVNRWSDVLGGQLSGLVEKCQVVASQEYS